jgi:hypothetical protein
MMHVAELNFHGCLLTRFAFTSHRFGGLVEKPAGSPNDNVKGKERKLIKAIPEHRIEQIK